MSATSTPFGFRPIYHNSGQMRPKAYTITSGYASNIFNGDPVKMTDDGVIQLGTSDGTRTGTTDGVALLGILAGISYVDSTGKPVQSPFWQGNTSASNIIAWVYDDPATIFEVQYANPAAGTSMQTSVGEECDWVVASPGGSVLTGLSTTALSAVQTTSGQFQITGIAGKITDAFTDAFVVVTVRMNEHHYQAPVNSI